MSNCLLFRGSLSSTNRAGIGSALNRAHDMKTVKVTLTLIVKDDQPVCDWLPQAIASELEQGEQLLEYNDDEPVVTTN